MNYRILIAILMFAFSSSIAWSAEDEKLPSLLMHDLPASVPYGYVPTWVFKIEIESADQLGIDQSRRVLSDSGFQILESRTTSTAFAKPLLNIVGTKEYAAPNATADKVLVAMKEATRGVVTKFSWSVAQKLSPKVQ